MTLLTYFVKYSVLLYDSICQMFLTDYLFIQHETDLHFHTSHHLVSTFVFYKSHRPKIPQVQYYVRVTDAFPLGLLPECVNTTKYCRLIKD